MTFLKFATVAVLVPVIRTVADVDRAVARWWQGPLRGLSATGTAGAVDRKGRTAAWRRGVVDGRNIERAGVGQ